MSIFDGNANPSRTQVTRPRLYHIFEASREQIRAAENGERHVLQMLPAYVNIQLTEYWCKTCSNSQYSQTSPRHFAETLDPPQDQYAAMKYPSRIFWQPGESTEDILRLMLT